MQNERPCAKNTIIATHGESALLVLKELIADGTVACRRGRNGGYYAVDAADAVESTVVTEEAAAAEAQEIAEVADLAEQFAALNARLAAAEAEEAAAVEEAPY